MNKPEAAKIVSILSAAYPQAQIKPETPMAYYLALSDISYSNAERAIAVLMRTSKFLPTAAEIREVLAEAVNDTPPWEEAWKELDQVVRRYGSYLLDDRYTKPDWNGWSSPEVEAAVKLVGYRNVCMMELDDAGTIRAQFRNAYEAQRQRQQTAVQVGDAALPRGNAPIPMLKKGDAA